MTPPKRTWRLNVAHEGFFLEIHDFWLVYYPYFERSSAFMTACHVLCIRLYASCQQGQPKPPGSRLLHSPAASLLDRGLCRGALLPSAPQVLPSGDPLDFAEAPS